MTPEEVVDKVVETLNRAFRADPKCMEAYTRLRVPINGTGLVDDPSIIVGSMSDPAGAVGDERDALGPIGLLNGILIDLGATRRVAYMRDDQTHEMTGFCAVYPPATPPPPPTV